MTEFGFPVGPFTLLDEVGLDVAKEASGMMYAALGERFAPAPGVDRMVEAGRLGRKSGRGFYRYRKGQKRAVDRSVYDLLGARRSREPKSDEHVEQRLLLILLNEAVRALSEGVVRRPRDGDIGAIFGFGFPAFLGGPFRYIDSRGPDAIREGLERYAARFERFAPAPLLVELSRTCRQFYGG
jgi:3-hydroxyacyl-CoA dehydrogenase/enoyl-CoA hydratase/3-hydroxybutyryl-CoA epimerase